MALRRVDEVGLVESGPFGLVTGEPGRLGLAVVGEGRAWSVRQSLVRCRATLFLVLSAPGPHRGEPL